MELLNAKTVLQMEEKLRELIKVHKRGDWSMNQAEELFEKLGFWNMSSVKISVRNQEEQLGITEKKEDDCGCGEHQGTNKNCSFCNQFAEQQTLGR